MQEGSDVHHAVPVAAAAQERFPELRACSFDRGFHSPENRRDLDAMLDLNALPKKGYLSKAERERQSEPGFAEARRQHPAVESAIIHLEHRGLDRIRSHGRDGFARIRGLSGARRELLPARKASGKKTADAKQEAIATTRRLTPPPFIETAAFSRTTRERSAMLRQPVNSVSATNFRRPPCFISRIRAGSAAGWRPGRAEPPPDAAENRSFLRPVDKWGCASGDSLSESF